MLKRVAVVAKLVEFVIQTFHALMALALQPVAPIAMDAVTELVMDVEGNALRIVPWDVAVILGGVALRMILQPVAVPVLVTFVTMKNLYAAMGNALREPVKPLVPVVVIDTQENV
jgi:hypothetical protein